MSSFVGDWRGGSGGGNDRGVAPVSEKYFVGDERGGRGGGTGCALVGLGDRLADLLAWEGISGRPAAKLRGLTGHALPGGLPATGMPSKLDFGRPLMLGNRLISSDWCLLREGPGVGTGKGLLPREGEVMTAGGAGEGDRDIWRVGLGMLYVAVIGTGEVDIDRAGACGGGNIVLF